MLSKVFSGTLIGLEPYLIEIEAALDNKGLPTFNIVGLADRAITEARDRIRAALNSCNLDLPERKITVNLAPADLQKSGSQFDLGIAVAILSAEGLIPKLDNHNKQFLLGELALNGAVRKIKGILPLVTTAANEWGFRNIFVPQPNKKEAQISKSLIKSKHCSIYSCNNLKDVLNFLTQNSDARLEPLKPLNLKDISQDSKQYFVDFADIKGQAQAKRGLEIAAAGGHNISLTGPPGAGKTMMSQALISILPPLTPGESLEVSKIYSSLGMLSSKNPLIIKRPFRAPHHTTSKIGIIGGGSNIKPGEISLAHRGVLFLDEFAELPRHIKESLRQPLEDGLVTISRASGHVKYPARFMLIAASNPCPCGYKGSSLRNCICSAHQILSYQKRLSGPILDRIDIHIFVKAVPVEKLAAFEEGEPSEKIAKRVNRARRIQQERLNNEKIFCNAEMSSKLTDKYAPLSKEVENFLLSAAKVLKLSARSFYKIKKVARTIADLEETENISQGHLAEALQYRPKEETF